jgi:hypothetical protein
MYVIYILCNLYICAFQVIGSAFHLYYCVFCEYDFRGVVGQQRGIRDAHTQSHASRHSTQRINASQQQHYINASTQTPANTQHSRQYTAHRYIYTSAHQHINTSTRQHSHQYINTSTQSSTQVINTSNTSTRPHISTVIFTSATNTSTHRSTRQQINTSMHQHNHQHDHTIISTVIYTSTINTSTQVITAATPPESRSQ